MYVRACGFVFLSDNNIVVKKKIKLNTNIKISITIMFSLHENNVNSRECILITLNHFKEIFILLANTHLHTHK